MFSNKKYLITIQTHPTQIVKVQFLHNLSQILQISLNLETIFFRKKMYISELFYAISCDQKSPKSNFSTQQDKMLLQKKYIYLYLDKIGSE